MIYEIDLAVQGIIKEFFLDAEVDADAERLRVGRRVTIPNLELARAMTRRRRRRRERRVQRPGYMMRFSSSPGHRL